MAVTDHLVKLPLGQPKKARSVAEPVARQTRRTQYRVLEGYSQRGVFFPQSRLFLCCFVFGLSKGAQAGILSPFKCQGPPLEELLLRELVWGYDLRKDPEAHRDALARDKILLTHFASRRRAGLHLLDRCIRHDDLHLVDSPICFWEKNSTAAAGH